MNVLLDQPFHFIEPLKNKKDFAQLQQQILHDATKKPGRISGLFSLKDQKDLLSE